MANQSEDGLFSYTDAEALAYGVLVSVNMSPVNRVTRSVFDHFVRRPVNPVTGPFVMDVTPVMLAIEVMLALRPGPDGWRIGSYEGKELWLVPNEVDGLTLMFPEDY